MESGDKQAQFAPQKIARFSDALAIYAADFPIYYIECISERHFVVAGGGGSSKTGVHNQINIIELIPTGDSCAANLVMKYKTPEKIPDAIMTGSLSKNLPIVKTRLVTGGTKAAIYHIDFDPTIEGFSIKDYDILDSSKVESEIKSVKHLGDKVLTGGIDGQLTLWNTSGESMDVERHVKAHAREISEIDIDEVSQQIITLSRDEIRCAVWNSTNFKLLHEFKKDIINPVIPDQQSGPSKYTYRSARFAYDTTQESSKKPGNSSLLIACNPIPAKGPSKLYKWNTHDYKNHIAISVTNDGVMAMTVSLDGKLVAIGTRSGSVSVFDVKSLKQIYKVDQAHHNAVTNLEFLAPRPESLSLTNSKLCPLLSVSIDRRIVLHRPGKGSLLASFFKTALLAFFVYLMFFVIYKIYTRDIHLEGNSTNGHLMLDR